MTVRRAWRRANGACAIGFGLFTLLPVALVLIVIAMFCMAMGFFLGFLAYHLIVSGREVLDAAYHLLVEGLKQWRT
jgi:hypothetical protein